MQVVSPLLTSPLFPPFMPCPARQVLLAELGSFFFNCYLSFLPSCELSCSSILYSNERKPLKTNHPTNKQGRKRKKEKKRYECSKAGTKARRFSLISTFDFFFFLETPKHFGFDARTRRASSVPSLLYHYNNSLSIKKKKKSFRTCCRELATLAHTHTHTNTEEHRRAEQFTLPCVFIFPRFAFFTPIR